VFFFRRILREKSGCPRESALVRGPWRNSSVEEGVKNKKIGTGRESRLLVLETYKAGRPARPGLSGFILCLAMFLQLSSFATGTVNLAWNPSKDPIVAGYNLYYGGASGVYTNEVKVGNATNITISGLVAGLTYHFAATTYSTSGVESPFSGEVVYLVSLRPVLSLRTTRSTSGVPISVTITVNGTIPNPWTLQSSTNLKTWYPLAQGTNPVISVSTSVRNLPVQFFRLVGQ
jgi:hypothetical protein